MSEPRMPRGAIDVAGEPHMRGPKGELLPLSVIKPQDLLQDGAVRDLFDQADTLSAQIAAFRAKAFEDVAALSAVLEELYKAKPGGAKGNMTLLSIDGLMRVTVQVADQIKFGPELQVAKSLVDQLVNEWSADSRKELKVILLNAFSVDQEGKLNRGAVLGLLRYEIEDPRWLKAMEAIRDSIKIVGSAEYIRFHRRATPKAPWIPVSLNMATAG